MAECLQHWTRIWPLGSVSARTCTSQCIVEDI